MYDFTIHKDGFSKDVMLLVALTKPWLGMLDFEVRQCSTVNAHHIRNFKQASTSVRDGFNFTHLTMPTDDCAISNKCA